MNENQGQETSLVRATRQELVNPAEFSKFDIGAVTMWFGTRDLVNDDLATFNFELNFRYFHLYSTFTIPEIDEFDGEAYPAFAQVDLDLRKEFEKIRNPLAVFIITTAVTAERPWLVSLPKGLHELREQQGRDQTTFIYKIILGAGFSQEGQQDPAGNFSKNEMRAAELGVVYIPYTHDYRSLGIRRTIEFMNRVLGHDLPGGMFPNYADEELRKIAWNINREDFNAFSPREDAIPKYPVVNGRPQFAF